MLTRRVKTLNSQAVLNLSGLDAEVFKINLVSDTFLVVATAFSPGVLYSFELVQDATGGRLFSWPGTFQNAPTVNPAANSNTVATYVARNNGQLYAIIPAMYD